MAEAGQGAGDSICTGGTQTNAASESTGLAEAERLALVPAVMPFGEDAHSASELLIAGSQSSVSKILAIAGDTLGEILDKREGHTVTDKNIYRYRTPRCFGPCPA